MATPEKEAVVKEVTEILENAKGVILADYQGLNVEKMSELRRRCREASVSLRVVKNTLARLAAKKLDHEKMATYLQGPSAMAYSYEDPTAPARIVSEFAKNYDKPTIKLSLFEGVFYGPERIQEIIALPTKRALLANMVRGFNAPIQGFVGGLSGLFQKLVFTLHAVKDTKEKGSL